jgi:hypothetical protein
MTRYADNFTSRFRVGYRSAGRQHSLKIRCGTLDLPTAVTGFAPALVGFLNALTGLRSPTWLLESVNFALAGTDVYLPVGLTSFTGIAAGVTTAPIDDKGFAPHFLSFGGRTYTGNNMRFALYGVAVDPSASPGNNSNDYRISRGESPEVNNAINEIFGYAALSGADGQPVVPYDYANVGVNAYWQRKIRRG